MRKNPNKAGEGTPLLGSEADGTSRNPKEAFDTVKVAFRRSAKPRRSVAVDTRQSIRGSQAGSYFADEVAKALAEERGEHFDAMEPVDALACLVAGGIIVSTSGYTTQVRAPSQVKSLPAYVPFTRKARHRSFYLWWLNEFRHWWKSSRLLVRLAGLFTLASTALFIDKMILISPFHHKSKAIEKSAYKALRAVKKLGRGGPLRYFLGWVHPFTRALRIVVAAWRWIEAAQCRRGEVGTEETMAFVGNRVSRMLARSLVDILVLDLMWPATCFVFGWDFMPEDAWHPIAFFMFWGIARACAPYAASFQGSRVGRVLTRTFFNRIKHRWLPIQPIGYLNLTSDDCCEKDEIDQNADLAKLGHAVAKALGKAQHIGVDGLSGQREALRNEGFRQIGAGSGGYAVYECHRRVWSRETTEEGESMTILLHVTPYGPSILDVMPRYVVLEFEDSVDRRHRWSEFISKRIIEGPPVYEGYCYNGAFFSPHHFAEMKEMYDKQLLAYDRACKAMCKPRTGRSPNPPPDLLSLKAFLVEGKLGRKRRQNASEGRQLQSGVKKVAKELKSMMSHTNPSACSAPKGVILYMEGLDCAGKSSTGGLVEQALQQAGYTVDMRQYNRPPTEVQKLRPWMDRFDVPATSMVVAVKNGNVEDDDTAKKLVDECVEHSHNALVWDRGPAGDFVYNPVYREMTLDERREKYREFMAFDRKCFENNILFLKLLFVTNRDSIAATLGKRLAQKKMANDLRTWLKASRGGESSYGEIGFEGLDAIEMHIDPTDFVAFNSYQTNLRIFSTFALNTDSTENPWIVVNTGDRYSARKHLLRAFQRKLDRFKKTHGCRPERKDTITPEDTPGISQEEMLARGFIKPLPVSTLVALAGILLLLFYYCEHTTFGTFYRDTFVKGQTSTTDDL